MKISELMEGDIVEYWNGHDECTGWNAKIIALFNGGQVRIRPSGWSDTAILISCELILRVVYRKETVPTPEEPATKKLYRVIDGEMFSSVITGFTDEVYHVEDCAGFSNHRTIRKEAASLTREDAITRAVSELYEVRERGQRMVDGANDEIKLAEELWLTCKF